MGVYILGTQCLNTAPFCAGAQALVLGSQVWTWPNLSRNFEHWNGVLKNSSLTRSIEERSLDVIRGDVGPVDAVLFVVKVDCNGVLQPAERDVLFRIVPQCDPPDGRTRRVQQELGQVWKTNKQQINKMHAESDFN